MTYDSPTLNLTREEALKLHRQMWAEMQEKLGDNPSADDREDFKRKWCREHFPNDYVNNHCFLCDYVFSEPWTKLTCKKCPIDWSGLSKDASENSTCYGKYKGKIASISDPEIYLAAPISEILALPERELPDV